MLREALSGIGTDEERLNEILTTRHPGQIKDLVAAYNEHEGTGDLWDDVCDDTSFKYERLLKCIMDRAAFFASLCFEAIDGAGTDEELIMSVLSALNRDNSGIHEVLSSFEDPFSLGWKDLLQRQCLLPDLQELQQAYVELDQRGYQGMNPKRVSMVEHIKSDFSGDAEMMILFLLRPKSDSGADAVHTALQADDRVRSLEGRVGG